MGAITVTTTPYEAHKDYVLNVLGRRCGWLARADREALYHDAYAVMLEKEQAGELATSEMRAAQVRAYLTQTALYKALDEGKRAERRRTAPLEDGALTAPDPAPSADDQLVTKLDAARVREIVDELPARTQAIVKMRFFFDRAPADIQRALGITERAYRRDLERGLRHIAERYELVRQGRFCESRRSLILAYVGGIAGPNREVEARRHLQTCPACMQWAIEMREATRAVAMLPLPAMVLFNDGPFTRLAEHVSDLSLAAKHHATSLLTRIDPTTVNYGPAMRPGAVGVAVAGCLAIGGGATYCVVNGVPQGIRAAVAMGEPHGHKPAPRKHATARAASTRVRTSSAVRARRIEPIAVAAPPKPAPKPAHQQRPRRAHTAPAAPRPAPSAPPPPPAQDAAGQEFGLEAPPPRRPSAPAEPARSSPPPNAPPGEFDP